MNDIDPNIFNNPTLGQNGHLPFLDEKSEQETENMRAKAEGREPRTVLRRDRYGVNGLTGPVIFDDEIEDVVKAETLAAQEAEAKSKTSSAPVAEDEVPDPYSDSDLEKRTAEILGEDKPKIPAQKAK
jgi:hypothetical protein